jgi:hypothetical protein
MKMSNNQESQSAPHPLLLQTQELMKPVILQVQLLLSHTVMTWVMATAKAVKAKESCTARLRYRVCKHKITWRQKQIMTA